MLITTVDALDELSNRIRREKEVALDTEFIWEKTYYPIPSIIQAGFSNGESYIIDVTALSCFSPFAEVMQDESIQKVLHDAIQDLVIISRITGAFPKNIFDTQLAMGFAGFTASMSLLSLLEEFLTVSIPKTETRTAWLNRPLSDKQVEYAIDDVRYLIRARDAVLARIKSAEAKKWLLEDLKKFNDSKIYKEVESSEYFRKIKGIGRFNSRQLNIFRYLIKWREENARRLNVPREHVLSNRTLLSIAGSRIYSSEKLYEHGIISSKIKSKYGVNIDSCLESGLNDDTILRLENVGRINKSAKCFIDEATAYVEELSVKYGIDPKLIAVKKEIVEFAWRFRSPKRDEGTIFKGWRKKILYKQFMHLAGKNMR